MHVAILSLGKTYSTKRIVEALTQRGHTYRLINVSKVYMSVSTHGPVLRYAGIELEPFDAVIPRIGVSNTFYGLAVLRQFETMGTPTLNDSFSIGRSRDKLRALQTLSRKGIGLPLTGFVNRADDVKDVISMVGGAPLVIKLLEGTHGVGVVLAETQHAAESVIEGFMSVKASILVQEYIREANGADIRCFVIGKKVVAAMKRQAPQGEFRSNLHRGGSGSKVKLSPEERSIAVRAAKIMGLKVAGVDLLRSNHGPVVMEVNSSPGLEGVEKVSGKDIATLMIQHLEKLVGIMPVEILPETVNNIPESELTA